MKKGNGGKGEREKGREKIKWGNVQNFKLDVFPSAFQKQRMVVTLGAKTLELHAVGGAGSLVGIPMKKG